MFEHFEQKKTNEIEGHFVKTQNYMVGVTINKPHPMDYIHEGNDSLCSEIKPYDMN